MCVWRHACLITHLIWWSLLSKLSPLPFSLTPPFLEKIFHFHPYCQIRGSQSSSFVGVRTMLYLQPSYQRIFRPLMQVHADIHHPAITNALLCNTFQTLFFLVNLWNLHMSYHVENRPCLVHSCRYTWCLLFLWILVFLFCFFFWMAHRYYTYMLGCFKCI